jgi:hypothetical protein
MRSRVHAADGRPSGSSLQAVEQVDEQLDESGGLNNWINQVDEQLDEAGGLNNWMKQLDEASKLSNRIKPSI